MRIKTAKAPGLLAIAAATFMASAAHADPCEAIPAKGPMPDYIKSGRAFTGPVVHIIDGDGLCVDVQGAWVEVRIADFYAPETSEPGGFEAAKALNRIASGKAVTCKAQRRSYDRVVAQCLLGGVSLGDLMREAGVAEGGKGFKGQANGG